MLDTKIESIYGTLQTAYNNCVPGTMMHIDELIRERKINCSNYTADGWIYSIEEGKPVLRITREAVNPIFKNIEEAFKQLRVNNYYDITSVDFEAVKAAPETLTIDLTKLRLHRGENILSESRYLFVDPRAGLSCYNDEEQKLLRRIFGQTNEEYETNVGKIYSSHRQTVKPRVCFLDPGYVEDVNPKEAIAQVSWIINFQDDSRFGAAYTNFSNLNRLFGVPKEE